MVLDGAYASSYGGLEGGRKLSDDLNFRRTMLVISSARWFRE
jgi:hypothetical protein